MNIGFVGVGKLGLPICVGIASVGHNVLGYDINEKYSSLVQRDNVVTTASDLLFSKETTQDGKTDLKTSPLLLQSTCKFTTSLQDTISHGDIIFCAIQTPHDPKYEGITSLPTSRVDFDYTFLMEGVKQINDVVNQLQKPIILVIISTVLPGTIRRCILPLIMTNKWIQLIYNPYFIAMGTVLYDFFNPEFILVGVDNNIKEETKSTQQTLLDFYYTIVSKDIPIHMTSIENAEMIKVSYNTFITAKICLTNTIMTMCDKLEGTNCDDVMKALFLGKNRIISSAYLQGGMGDGGGCHPRDNIAMSWLSQQLHLPFNFYDGLMYCREQQTMYFVQLIQDYQKQYPDLPVILLGKAFKPQTDLIIGSPAMLLFHLCQDMGVIVYEHIDPYVDKMDTIHFHVSKLAIYCLATRHELFSNLMYPPGSVVIDPFRFLSKTSQQHIIYHPVGKLS